jgi:hypothetical protein
VWLELVAKTLKQKLKPLLINGLILLWFCLKFEISVGDEELDIT